MTTSEREEPERERRMAGTAVGVAAAVVLLSVLEVRRQGPADLLMTTLS